MILSSWGYLRSIAVFQTNGSPPRTHLPCSLSIKVYKNGQTNLNEWTRVKLEIYWKAEGNFSRLWRSLRYLPRAPSLTLDRNQPWQTCPCWGAWPILRRTKSRSWGRARECHRSARICAFLLSIEPCCCRRVTWLRRIEWSRLWKRGKRPLQGTVRYYHVIQASRPPSNLQGQPSRQDCFRQATVWLMVCLMVCAQFHHRSHRNRQARNWQGFAFWSRNLLLQLEGLPLMDHSCHW